MVVDRLNSSEMENEAKNNKKNKIIENNLEKLSSLQMKTDK